MIVLPFDIEPLNAEIIRRAQLDIPILESRQRRFLGPLTAVLALVLNLGCGVAVAHAAVASAIPLAQTHTALAPTVSVRHGCLRCVQVAATAVSRRVPLPLATLAPGDVLPSSHRLQMARVDALSVPAEMVEVETGRNRTNQKRIRDAVTRAPSGREERAVTQADSRIPLLRAARPHATRVRITRRHSGKARKKLGCRHALQSMTYRFSSKGHNDRST
jgi:hypothetical protein